MFERNLRSYEQSLTSWTDDVPTCRESGVGSSPNEVYRKDGRRGEMHSFEDRSFHFRVEEYNLCLYGVFDGFHGAQVADFVMKRLPAEVLFGQLIPDSSDEIVKDILKQAFVCVDKEYFESIGDKLAHRMMMKSDPQFANDSKLNDLDNLVVAGCSATVALTLNNKLFVGNVGDCQAILCTLETTGSLKVIPLSIDHVLGNEDESLRLQHLGLNLENGMNPFGDTTYTRCLGNYPVKGGYKEMDALKSCRDDPVIAEPEIQGGIPIHDSFQFLILFTKSLSNALEETGSSDPGGDLANICLNHYKEHSTMSAIAQAAVDTVVRIHRQHFEESEASQTSSLCKEDMTLLVRNFGCRLSAQNCVSPGRKKEEKHSDPKTLTRGSTRVKPLGGTRSSTTTESSGVVLTHGRELPMDENGRIQPYVDFGPFYKLWNQRQSEGEDPPDK